MGRNGYFYSEAKADWGTPAGIEYSRTAAFAYIRKYNLQGELLKVNGIECSEDQVQSAWYDFLEKHSGDQYAYIYINFVKEYKKKHGKKRTQM